MFDNLKKLLGLMNLVSEQGLHVLVQKQESKPTSCKLKELLTTVLHRHQNHMLLNSA